MPSGKTHDFITLLALAPTFAVSWIATNDLQLSVLVTAATAFSGFMFGPDLDIQSSQYSRWGVFRFLWLPYKIVFAHRSRWSHGLLFGTLIRVLYFSGIIALLVALGLYLRAFLIYQSAPDFVQLWSEWQSVQRKLMIGLDAQVVVALLLGLWWGAATHTLTDVGSSMLRKGKDIF